MVSVVRAMGIALERAGVLMQAITGDDLLWLGCVILVFCVAVTLIVLWTAITVDWWNIAGRYIVAVFLKDRAAELRRWKENWSRVQRVRIICRTMTKRR